MAKRIGGSVEEGAGDTAPAAKKAAGKKPTAKKEPAAKKAAAKRAAAKAPSAGPREEVIVGRLTDWPLGARMAALLGLPESVTAVGCFQALGAHGAAVSKKVFEVKETIDPAFAPFERRLHAALAPCGSLGRGQILSYQAFHANLSAEELRAYLGDFYLVRTPAEALDARRLTPEQSLARIEEAAAKVSVGCPRKYLLEYLGGGKLRDSLLGAKAYGLSQIFVAHPEAFNEVDARLFHLWALTARDSEGAPMPQPDVPELGFDRFGAHREHLIAAGLHPNATISYFLRRRPMEHARWWPSTGMWVWEQLAADASKLLQHTIVAANEETGDIEMAIAEALTSVLWLPKGALDNGALEVVSRVCASPALVPQRTFDKLRADKALGPLLAAVERGTEVAPVRGRSEVRQGRKLIAG